MVLAIFFKIFFFGNIAQENVFHDILEPEIALPGFKNKRFKKSKTWHFSHGFGPKMAIFPTFFFLGNIGHENVFNDILKQKKTLSGL